MKAPSGTIRSVLLLAGLLAGGLIVATNATAQCGSMGGAGGGHDHGAMNSSRLSAPANSDKKLNKRIDQLLVDERGRQLLMDALVKDRAFMQVMIRRMSAVPEWRSLAAQQLGVAPTGADVRAAQPAPAPSVVYTCPMHAEVTSATSGACPKCGMALVRREPR